MLGSGRRPMRKNPEAQERDLRAVQSVKLPREPGGPSGKLSAMHALAEVGGELQGTIGATVQPIGDWSYGMLSDNWIRGTPLGPVPNAAVSESSPLRAKDLIAELDSINAQIHRMMFQVERAVSRLATSG
jgi:hypothetical protein